MATKRFEQHISSLHNGISRQAPSVRFPNQVADAENVLFSIIDGATTRPGSRHHIIIEGTGANNVRMHKIERDDNEEYVIVYGKGTDGFMKLNVVQVNNPRNRRQWVKITQTTPPRTKLLPYPAYCTYTLTFGTVTTAAIAYGQSGSTGNTITPVSATNAQSALDAALGAGVATVYLDNETPGVLTIDINDEYPVQSVMTAAFVAAPGAGATIEVIGTVAKLDITNGTNAAAAVNYLKNTQGIWEQETYNAINSGSTETFTEADDLCFLTITDTTFICNKKKHTWVLATNDSSNPTDVAGTTISSTYMPCQIQRTSIVPPIFTLSQPNIPKNINTHSVMEITVTITTGTWGYYYKKIITDNVTTVSGLAWDITAAALQTSIQASTGWTGAVQVIKVDNKYTIFLLYGNNLYQMWAVNNAHALVKTRDEQPLAPEPFIKGYRINDMVYHRGRIGLAMEEWMVFSQPDDLWNFYRTRADQIDPGDAISLQIGAETVSKIDFVVPFRKGLLLLTQGGRQFDMGGGDLFSAETATFTPATAIATSSVRPTSVGFKSYFCGSRETLTPVWEYNYDEFALTNKATEITNHVHDLIPKNVKSMTSSDNNSTVMILPKNPLLQYFGATISSANRGGGNWSSPSTWNLQTAPGCDMDIDILDNDTITFDEYGKSAPVYVYKQFTKNDELLQSAWSIYDFKTDIIQDIKVVDDTVFIARNQQMAMNTGIVIESMPLTQKPEPPKYWEIQPRMDHRHVFNTKYGTVPGQYSSIITFTLPYQDKTIDTAVIITNPSSLEYTEVPVTNNNGTSVTMDFGTVWAGQQNGGDPNSYVTVVLGRKIDFNIVLSKVYEKDQQGNSKISPIIEISNTVIDHKDSGNYSVQAETKNAVPRVTTFTTSAEEIVNKSGKLKAYTTGKTEDLVISISTNSTKPVTITSIEYHGKVTTGGIE